MAGKYLVVSLLLILLIAFFITFSPRYTGFFSSVSGSNATLSIWDQTDLEGGGYQKYTYPTLWSNGYTRCQYKEEVEWNVYFFANYTNSSGDPIDDGNCTIRFNETGNFTDWYEMSYNSSSHLFQYNKSFNYDGNLSWEVNCNSDYDNLTTSDYVKITNTPPCVFAKNIGGYLSNQTITEDIDMPWYYNFSKNCSDDDFNDRLYLTYSYTEENTTLTNFTINNATGMLMVNITQDDYSGNKIIVLTVRDEGPNPDTATLPITINKYNDPPQFINLPNNLYATEDQIYSLDIEVSDEEDNTPFFFNLTFINCAKAPWNVSDNCSIFSINETTGFINFTPTNWDVGNYTINFTVRDSGNTTQPYNATGWKVVNFEVINVNDLPNMTFVENQNLCQNDLLEITINGTDIENDTLIFNTTTLHLNLTPYSNTSLFPILTDNSSFLSNKSNPVYGKMNYTLGNHQVGNYTINITLSDGYDIVSQLVNFTICNINDPPVLDYIPNLIAVQEEEFYYDINATDPDQQTPYSSHENATLTYNVTNTTPCSLEPGIGTECLIITINETTGVINFTPARNNSGNYTLNISVRDGGNLTDWQEANMTIVADYPPNFLFGYEETKNGTQNESFYFEINATDPENDSITFYSETYYLNLTAYENISLFPISIDNSSAPIYKGIMNYILDNSQVGNYTIKIIAKDIWNRTNYTYVNFTIYNINDPPQIINFTLCDTNTSEQISNQTVYEDQLYCKKVNVIDIDMLTPYGDTLIYNMTFINGSPLFSINSSTGIINFTATNDSWADNYTVNITVTDSNNSVDFMLINYTIIPVNDPPYFTNLDAMNKTAIENQTFYYDLNAADEEDNQPFYFNLTFINCSKRGGNNSNCSIFSINETTGVINFTITNLNDTGNYTINFTVRDSGETNQPYNATGWKVVNFTIIPINHPPKIDFYGSSQGTTPIIEETQSISFFVNASDEDDDELNYTTYVDHIQHECKNVKKENDTSYDYIASYTPTFSDSGTHLIEIIVNDINPHPLQASCNFTVNVTNKNRPPYQQFLIQNQTWNMNTENTNIQLTYYFRDPDNENTDPCNESVMVTNDDNNFTYTWVDGGFITVYIDDTSRVHIIPNQNWYGITWIVFNVSDGEYNATSNNVTLNVTYTESIQQQQQSTGGGTGTTTTTETKAAALSIIIQKFEKLTPYNKTVVPIKLKNTGQVMLNSISLSAKTEETTDLTLQLDKTSISQLNVNEEASVEITVTSYNLTKEDYEIRFLAVVNSPRLNQTSVIYLKTMPKNKTEIEEKLKLVKDLFEENPECLDLWELISDAEKELKKENIEKAKELTDLAIKNCMDLISYKSEIKTVPTKEQIDYNKLINVFLLMSLFSLIIYYAISSRHRKVK
ncbi:MAG: cadherin repeat domain-containing protein [Candidatus Aenigmatarchaeota archaeon]